MTIDNFIEKIKQNYNKDINENIEYQNGDIILHNNKNFDFSLIFIVDLLKSDLQKKYEFVPIGTSEDNNIHINSEYYLYFSSYYARWNFDDNVVILRKR
jgi:hypothetical protein